MSSMANRSVIVGGHRIAYDVLGAGEPVVLVHGTPSSSYIWRAVAPALRDAGVRVFTFDLLGYGASERPWSRAVDTSVSGQVPLLRELLDAWKLKRVHLVGHDIGGAVCQRFTIFHPRAVKSLTLVDSVSFKSWPSKRTKQQMKRGIDVLMKQPEAGHRAHMREWLLSAVYNQERFATEAVDAYLDLICGPVGQASFFQHQVAHYDPRHTAELTERLSELGAKPVQILWGENDTWQVPDWAYKLHDAIPGSSLRLLPECGHFAMEDRPDDIAAYIRSLVAANMT